MGLVFCIILMSLGAVCLTLFLLEKVRKYSVKATLIKATTSFLFIATAAVSNYFNGGHPLGLYVICGLALGLMGDIWLDFKYVFKEHSRPFTYAGFICFAIGHLFYISGLYVTMPYTHAWYAFVGPLSLGLLAGVMVLVMEKPLKMVYGEYKTICFIYGSIMFSTAFVSLYLATANGFQNPTLNMFFAGGLLFAISDLILCGTYFGEGKERPFDIISNAVTYYGAQYVIAFSLFFIL